MQSLKHTAARGIIILDRYSGDYLPKWYWHDCFPCTEVSCCLPATCLNCYSQIILISSFLQPNSSFLISHYLRLFAPVQQSCLLAPQHEERNLLWSFTCILLKVYRPLFLPPWVKRKLVLPWGGRQESQQNCRKWLSFPNFALMFLNFGICR